MTRRSLARRVSARGYRAAVCRSRRRRRGRTSAAGLRFVDVTTRPASRSSTSPVRSARKYLPETLGSGVAFFDADGDGWQESCCRTARAGPGRRGRDGDRAAVSEQRRRHVRRHHARSGLGSPLYGMGAAAADFDNDGRAGRDHHGRRAEPSVPQHRRRHASLTSPMPQGWAGEAASARRRCGSTTTATGCSTC